MRLRRTLRRWHVWLGWLIGLPLLFWTVSGVVMVWKPIDEVRGSDLLAPVAPIRLTGPAVAPNVAGLPLDRLSLESRATGPRWVVAMRDGPTRLADPNSGLLLPPLGPADAASEVMARYRGTATVVRVSRTDAAHPPLELRRPVAAYEVDLSDGTHFFVDAASGEVIARRTRWWRFYDWMWGLHIMDLGERENTHNPWVIGFGLAALAGTMLALLLLPLTVRRRRARTAAPPASRTSRGPRP
ncbi:MULTISPECIES: PepSY domain-containing protein [Sphingomonas]|uniref:PepSY domain-containing protein n=1 Tax=Sphingomonas TaxID=13687 RepID=UPI000DF01589|nr:MULTISPECIES: PepSY domain-containing protein [Sphingomonas]